MRVIQNAGTDRVFNHLQPWLKSQFQLDLVTNAFSLFALSSLRSEIVNLARVRIIIPPNDTDLGLLGAETDRAMRNQLQSHWLAKRGAAWIEQK